MDETYIKMCDCEEIQEGHVWESGDWAYWPENGDVYPLCSDRDYNVGTYAEGHKWLPLQGQLQEMVGGNNIKTLRNLVDSVSWVDPFDLPLPSSLDDNASMEQLWLAFVMKELYNKTWLGEEWL